MDQNTGISFTITWILAQKAAINHSLQGETMSLNKALEGLKFDKRLVELNIKMGRVSQQEIDQNDKNLQDLEAQSEKLDLDQEDKDLT